MTETSVCEWYGVRCNDSLLSPTTSPTSAEDRSKSIRSVLEWNYSSNQITMEQGLLVAWTVSHRNSYACWICLTIVASHPT